MKNYSILLATHGENLHWLRYLPIQRNYNLIVSNSAGISKPENADELILRENYGREAGHYLNYIIERWDDLADTTVFMQGDPWPHAAVWGNPSILLEVLFGSPQFRSPICYLGKQYSTHPNQHKEGLINGKPSEHFEALKIMWPDQEIGPAIPISIGANFYVSREVIHAKPRELYQKLLAHALVRPKYEADPYYTLAHTLEGVWGSVFEHAGTSVI